MMPVLGTRPKVGLTPTMPQNAAGPMIDPPVSVPTDRGISRAATAAPEPEDEPHAHRSRSHGFEVVALEPAANSKVYSLAIRTAPAASSRSASVALSAGTLSLYSADPPVVRTPAVAMMSLRPYGTPSSGRACPVIHRSVDSLACVVARSTSHVRTALTRPSSRSIRPRQDSRASDGEARRDRNSLSSSAIERS